MRLSKQISNMSYSSVVKANFPFDASSLLYSTWPFESVTCNHTSWHCDHKNTGNISRHTIAHEYERSRTLGVISDVEMLHTCTYWKDYTIDTLHYNWPMSAHASQAFSTYSSACDCTDLDHLPHRASVRPSALATHRFRSLSRDFYRTI